MGWYSPVGANSPSTILYLTMEKAFKEALKAIEKVSEYSEKIKELALISGAEENGLNSHNALLACEKSIKEFAALKVEIKKLGTTLPNLIKSYKMIKNRGESLVPEYLKFVPPQWILKEKLSPEKAKRLLNSLGVQLETLFQLIEESQWGESEKEQYKNEIIECFGSYSSEEFSIALSRALWNLNVEKHPGHFRRWEELAKEEESVPEVSANTPEFIQCVRWSTAYSANVRGALENWALREKIDIDPDNLSYWASCEPERLHAHLVRRKLGEGEGQPINRWVKDSLQEAGLIDSSTGIWSEKVSLSLIEDMVTRYRKMLKVGGNAVTHEDIVANLTNMVLSSVGQGLADQLALH